MEQIDLCGTDADITELVDIRFTCLEEDWEDMGGVDARVPCVLGLLAGQEGR